MDGYTFWDIMSHFEAEHTCMDVTSNLRVLLSSSLPFVVCLLSRRRPLEGLIYTTLQNESYGIC